MTKSDLKALLTLFLFFIQYLHFLLPIIFLITVNIA